MRLKWVNRRPRVTQLAGLICRGRHSCCGYFFVAVVKLFCFCRSWFPCRRPIEQQFSQVFQWAAGVLLHCLLADRCPGKPQVAEQSSSGGHWRRWDATFLCIFYCITCKAVVLTWMLRWRTFLHYLLQSINQSKPVTPRRRWSTPTDALRCDGRPSTLVLCNAEDRRSFYRNILNSTGDNGHPCRTRTVVRKIFSDTSI